MGINLMTGTERNTRPTSPGPRMAPACMNVLVIGNDPKARNYMKKSLRENGHTVILGVDGEHGVALAEREMPDLIILDLEMPGMNGYEVSAALAAQPHTAVIPILMLTTYVDPEEANCILNGYADGLVTKPVSPTSLLAHVGALGRRTHRLTRAGRGRQWVINRLANNAIRDRFHIYSQHLVRVPDAPLNWRKPLPDLIITRGKSTTAFLVETIESLHEERTISRWEAIESLKSVRVRLVAQSREAAQLATKIKRERRLRAQIQYLHPRRQLRPPWLAKVLSPRSAKYFFAVAVALIISLFVSGVIPNLFVRYRAEDENFRAQMNIYQPKDAERHLHRINQLMHGLMEKGKIPEFPRGK